MRVAIISGSRADRGPLEAVRDELMGYGGFAVDWYGNGVWQDIPHTSTMLDADISIILGDRAEMAYQALSLNLAHIPIAHISGGDITEGSQDDCFRHAITKLSHIHFPSNEDSARRIIQMGEEPWRVHMVGAPSIDRLRKTELLTRAEACHMVWDMWATEWEPQKLVLVSYHPNTLGDTASELDELLAALRALDSDTGLVLIGPNHDEGWGLIDTAWKLLASSRPNTVYHPHLESQLYLSLMKHCDVMVGNSSAMIYEAPYYGTVRLILGDRQEGRPLKGRFVKRTFNRSDIQQGFDTAFQWDKLFSFTGKQYLENNYFGDGHACERIAKVLKELPDKDRLLRKKWYTGEDYNIWTNDDQDLE